MGKLDPLRKENVMRFKKIGSNAVLAAVLVALVLSAPAADGRATAAAAVAAVPLSEVEAAGLVFMREEEKLARDVYRVMWEKWGLQIFENIMQSEQRHMDAILYLLGKYGLEDPAIAPGIFNDSDLQGLYDELVQKGELSVVDAVEVGVIIEQTDIDDITELLSQTDKTDIVRVYTNLLNGSYSHLAAFEKHLPAGDGL